MWCILVYLRAIFVATPTGEVSEVEIFLRFDGVPEPAPYSRAPARNSPYSCINIAVYYKPKSHIYMGKGV